MLAHAPRAPLDDATGAPERSAGRLSQATVTPRIGPVLQRRRGGSLNRQPLFARSIRHAGVAASGVTGQSLDCGPVALQGLEESLPSRFVWRRVRRPRRAQTRKARTPGEAERVAPFCVNAATTSTIVAKRKCLPGDG